MAAAADPAWLKREVGAHRAPTTTSASASGGGRTRPGSVGSAAVRVDNWGNFLAQRIQALYDKQEHCDLTLRFSNCDFKAHSLILHACTPFFTALLKGKTSGHKILKMPPQISADTMSVILKFVYTGRLEAPFRMDELLRTAKLLKLQILIRLLEAQRLGTSVSADVNGLRHFTAAPYRAIRGRPKSAGQRPVYQPTNSQTAQKRSSTLVRPADPPPDARPSRFEMPDEPDGPASRVPAVDSAARAHRPATTSSTPTPGTAASGSAAGQESMFDSLRQTPTKRPAPAPAPHVNGGTPKRPRTDATDDAQGEEDISTLKEYYEEQRRRAQLLGEVSTDDAETAAGTTAATEGLAQVAAEDAGSDSVSAAPETATRSSLAGAPTTPGTPATPRPILKQEAAAVSSAGVSATSSSAGKKRVQFSESPQLTVSVPEGAAGGHELVTELLRQHPDILRAGQNVKVRLVTSSGGQSRAELITVQQTDVTTPQLHAPLTCSLCSRGDTPLQFSNADELTKHFRQVHSDPSGIDLNTLSCTACERAGDPQAFASVEAYLTHLRDKHAASGAGSGARICARCGFSCANRLQFMYHEYTRHQVQPPRFIHFPKCERCGFEAMTEPDLALHRQKQHRLVKEYKCKDCSGTFPTIGHLEQHMRLKECKPTPEPRKRVDQWKCEFCGMCFSRCYNLKAHLRSVHRSSSEAAKPAAAAAGLAAATAPVKEEPEPAADAAPLDPSSEAEAMSTVASSVATSLSLAVDGEYMALPDGVVPVEDEHGHISYIALRPADTAGAVPGGAVMEVTQYTMPVMVRPHQAGRAPAAGGSAGEAVLPDLCLTTSAPGMELAQTSAPQVALLSSATQVTPAVVTSALVSARRGQMAGLVSSSRITVSDSDYAEEPAEEEPPQLYQHPETGQLYAAVCDADGTTTLVPHNPDGTPELPQQLSELAQEGDALQQHQNVADVGQPQYQQAELVTAPEHSRLAEQGMQTLAAAERAGVSEDADGSGEAILGMASSHDGYSADMSTPASEPAQNQVGLAELAAVAADAGHIQVSQLVGPGVRDSAENAGVEIAVEDSPDPASGEQRHSDMVPSGMPPVEGQPGHPDGSCTEQTTQNMVPPEPQAAVSQATVLTSAPTTPQSTRMLVSNTAIPAAPRSVAQTIATSAGTVLLVPTSSGVEHPATSGAGDQQLVLVLGEGTEAGWPAGQVLVETPDGRRVAGQTLQYVDGRQVSLIVHSGEQYVPGMHQVLDVREQVLQAGELTEVGGAELAQEVVVEGQAASEPQVEGEAQAPDPGDAWEEVMPPTQSAPTPTHGGRINM